MEEEMQERILIYFQEMASPLLDVTAEAVTMLGEQYFYIGLIAYIFWNISKRAGLSLSLAYLFSALTNAGIKLSVRSERPFEVLSFIEGKRIHTATGYSFPSGHTQGAAGFLTAAALILRKGWFTAAAVLIMLLVAVSRVYLGVHWPVDVLFGLVFGVLAGGAVFILITRLFDRRRLFETVLLFLVIAIAAATTLLLILDAAGLLGSLKISDVFKIAGTSVGAVGGYLLEEHFACFSTAGGTGKKIIRFLLGLAGTIAVLVGLKLMLPEGNGFNTFRYLLTGMWLTFFFPWTGIRTGLFDRDDTRL
jgi:undecaprenyl-diphosphatase